MKALNILKWAAGIAATLAPLLLAFRAGQQGQQNKGLKANAKARDRQDRVKKTDDRESLVEWFEDEANK